ncbi:MAG TPA: PatB family C-S lyase [Rectinemataceae bacterium]|nr:PatB family C-S lyase [Rectinemataceae bacterium]
MNSEFDEIIDRRNSNSIKWNRYKEDVIPLWVADMDFRSPPPVAAALHKAVDHGVFGYPDTPASLRGRLASRMERLYGWEVDPDWVVATTGLVSGFHAAAAALCEPGEGYLIQPPVYMPFNELGGHLGLVRQEAPLATSESADSLLYSINWDIFESAFGSRGARTAMFLLCDPHNPVGLVWDEATQRRMAEAAISRGAAIVSDEIHAELLLDDIGHRPVAAADPAFAARSVTLVSPSKTFNIAGLFCGFAIMPDAGIRAAFEREEERMTLHCTSLSLVAAEEALSGSCDTWLADVRDYLRANRDFVLDFLRERMPSLRATRPAATHLLWLDCRRLGLDSPADFFLERARVGLNDGAAFGAGGKGFVRLNFASPRSLLAEALERMARAIDDRAGPSPRE